MGADDAESRFAINLDSNVDEVTAEAASELEQFRQRIAGSTDAVKRLSAANRALRGSSDEVKRAKSELKTKIDAERDSISADNLALLKHGTTYDQVAGHAKKLEVEKRKLDDQLKSKATLEAKSATDAMGNAVKLAGGPVQDMFGKFEALDGVLGEAGGALGGVTLAAAGAVAGFAALAGGVLWAATELGKFVVTNAAVSRSMGLVREAAIGNADDARALGHQIDDLASKVPTSTSALNDLAVQLYRTRLTSGAVVDTLNAVGQASAAMGDEVGKQLKDIITRGQVAQRLQINPFELQGTGLKFDDIAGQLAAQLHIGIDQARTQLLQGRVKLDDGAKAIRKAVEARFGEINLRQALSAPLENLRKNLTALARDVNLEPLLNAADRLVKIFDVNTVSGYAIKQLITLLGDGLSNSLGDASLKAEDFFEDLEVDALKGVLALLTLKNSFKDAFGAMTDRGGKIVESIQKIGDALGISFGDDSLSGLNALPSLVDLAKTDLDALDIVLRNVASSLSLIKKVMPNWSGIGTAIPEGIAAGISAKASTATDAVKGLADDVKKTFAKKLEIHSPSRVMFGQGGNVPEGVAGGVRARTALVVRAVEDMGADAEAAGELTADGGSGYGASAMARGYETAPTSRAPAPAEGGASGGGSGITIDVGGITIELKGGDKEIAKQIETSSIVAQLTKALRDAVAAAGVPTQGAKS